MLSPNDGVPELVGLCKAGAEVFYDLRHQEIFRALVALREKNGAIDLITLPQWLKDRNQLENVGGLAYLSSLPDVVPSAANLSYYAEIVLEKFTLRRMITVCTDAVANAYEHEGNVDGLLDAVEADVLQIAQARDVGEVRPMSELVKGAVGQIQTLFENKGALTGIATGFLDLDRLTNGLQKGDMIVIGARPSLGKTSLAMNIAEHVAISLVWMEETDDLEVVAAARKSGLKVTEF